MADLVKEYLKKVDGVSHITFDPHGPGVVRVYLIPPKKLRLDVPWVILLNGQDLLPINCGWAILLREFIETINESGYTDITEEELKLINNETLKRIKKVFPKTKESMLKKDLSQIIDILIKVSKHKAVKEEIGYLTLNKYAKYLKAPHRMDLMISSMQKDGHWNCNQKCIHCYCGNQEYGNSVELSTEEWKKIIDKLRDACIPQITFTGGEPTRRSDLVELVDYSKWFVTRLNTNGQLLTKQLCSELYDASLDSVQVTFYSSNKDVHNFLVGTTGFDKTIEGIKNAVEAGLNISLNTPLCSLNKDYLSTIKYAHETLGIKYFTCSSLIVTGNALNDESIESQLDYDTLYSILKEAKTYCDNHQLEISFTSPGWIKDEDLSKLGLTIPSCGAALSNMAINPSGFLVPCQSWLSDEPIGLLLDNSFKSLWESKVCKNLRKETSKLNGVCPLNARGNK